MSWKIEVSEIAEKQLNKLDKAIQKRLVNYLFERIEGCKDPRHFGEALQANKTGLWRYRVGDFRIVCEIQDEKLIVLALTIGHRENIYK